MFLNYFILSMNYHVYSQFSNNSRTFRLFLTIDNAVIVKKCFIIITVLILT